MKSIICKIPLSYRFSVLLWVAGLTFILALPACTKDKTLEKDPSAVSDCPDFDFSLCWMVNGVFSPELNHDHRYAVFNPNNPDEFICFEYDIQKPGSQFSSLIRYNMRTGEKKVLIYSFRLLGWPSWGRSGYIVFSTYDWKIWRIKDDGTGLKQISFNPNDQDPVFNYAGDKIIHPRSMEFSYAQIRDSPALQQLNNMRIIDINGNVLDSICVLENNFCKNWDHSSWSADGKILHVAGTTDYYGISYYDYKNHTEGQQFFGEPFTKPIQRIQWHPDGESFFYSTYNYLFRYHIQSGQRDTIRANCDAIGYGGPSVSGDGKKLLAYKIIREQSGPCEIRAIDTYLVLMDVDGRNEERVVIPE